MVIATSLVLALEILALLPISSLHAQLVVNYAYASSLALVQRRTMLMMQVFRAHVLQSPRRLLLSLSERLPRSASLCRVLCRCCVRVWCFCCRRRSKATATISTSAHESLAVFCPTLGLERLPERIDVPGKTDLERSWFTPQHNAQPLEVDPDSQTSTERSTSSGRSEYRFALPKDKPLPPPGQPPPPPPEQAYRQSHAERLARGESGEESWSKHAERLKERGIVEGLEQHPSLEQLTKSQMRESQAVRMSQVIGHSRPSSVTESAPGLNRHSTTGEMGDLNLSRSHDSRLQRAKKHNTKKQRKQTLFKFIDDADADEDELDPLPAVSPLSPFNHAARIPALGLHGNLQEESSEGTTKRLDRMSHALNDRDHAELFRAAEEDGWADANEPMTPRRQDSAPDWLFGHDQDDPSSCAASSAS